MTAPHPRKRRLLLPGSKGSLIAMCHLQSIHKRCLDLKHWSREQRLMLPGNKESLIAMCHLQSIHKRCLDLKHWSREQRLMLLGSKVSLIAMCHLLTSGDYTSTIVQGKQMLLLPGSKESSITMCHYLQNIHKRCLDLNHWPRKQRTFEHLLPDSKESSTAMSRFLTSGDCTSTASRNRRPLLRSRKDSSRYSTDPIPWQGMASTRPGTSLCRWSGQLP